MTEFTHNEPIRAAAEQFIADHKLTQAQFTAKLAGNFSTTRVAKYLNLNKAGNKPEPDAGKVEAAVRSFLRHVDRGAKLKASLYENSVSKDVASIMRQIRRTGDVGLIHGDGGNGKTCGAILFCRDNPDTLFVTAKWPYGCGDWAIANMIFSEFEASVADKWTSSNDLTKWDWLEKHLRGTDRLLVIDDAELLQVPAFRLIFSLNDATGIPVALIGNTEVIEKIKAADPSGKMISRIGIVHHARMKNDEEESARKLIERFAPESGEDLVESVTDTIERFGHSRRARKQLTLAVNLRDGDPRDKDWVSNYDKAGEKLIAVADKARGAK
jgi:DNA transposition AAA+ family ATPase